MIQMMLAENTANQSILQFRSHASKFLVGKRAAFYERIWCKKLVQENTCAKKHHT